jgi:tetratricopeptide (TPR) repeat protein
MVDRQRIADLRRRIQRDPASIAFAQLAEDLRRAGELDEAVAVCRTGLRIHPDYISARITLGRALLAANQLDAARAEFQYVRSTAPGSAAALRGLANIAEQTGQIDEAVALYRAAIRIAPKDPELPRIVARLSATTQAREAASERERAARTIEALERFASAFREPRRSQSTQRPQRSQRL